MNALVVYESFWGNTEAVARAIAEGVGGDTRAVHTDEATPEMLQGVELLVVGAPLMGFALPRKQNQDTLPADKKAPRVADASHPLMREWLKSVPKGTGRYAAFETRFKWSPGSATGGIAKALEAVGYRPAVKRERFLISGTYGPMRDGEIERARAWGTELAKAIS